MGDSRTDPVATDSVANASDDLGSTLLVEGNGGPWLGIDENKAIYADADIAPFGGANTAYIPNASSEAEKDFNVEDYVDWEGGGGGGDGCYHRA